MARKKPAPKATEQDPINDPALEAEVAALVQAAPPPIPTGNRPPTKTWSALETREQLAAVDGLLVEGARLPEIHRVLRRQWLVSMKRVRILVERVKKQWADFSKDDERVSNREAALRRLHSLRRVAEGTRDPKDPTGQRWLTKPDHKAVIAYERLIADLEGTKSAIEISVDGRFTTAMLEVVANLTGEQSAEMLEEAMHQKALADLARRELPALVVESVPGKASSHAAE